MPGVARGFPLASGGGFPLCRVAQSLPFAGWLRDSSSPVDSKHPFTVARGFSRPVVRRLPAPGGSGIPKPTGLEASLCRVAPGFPSPVDSKYPVAGWLQDSLSPVDSKYPFAVALGNFLRPMARGYSPLPGGSEFPLHRWLRVSPRQRLGVALCRVARGFPLAVDSGVSPFASGSGFPLRRLPFPVVRKFLRLFVPDAQGVAATNFKILWPSTSHPQLTRGCPPRQTFLHRILHSPVHRLGEAAKLRGRRARTCPRGRRSASRGQQRQPRAG